MRAASLRLRLTLIILLPLVLIAGAIGAWQVNDARRTAAEVFDRSLLTTALAITADVARSNGDAISPETRDRLNDTSGGPVFYHVYAPDGVFVTGYATPPVPTDIATRPETDTEFYTAQYYGRDVRVVRLRDVTTIGGISGEFVYTVWQDVRLRNEFVRDLSARAFAIMATLIGSVALVVWFGVNTGLRPLRRLEDAISARNSDDLRPIRRAVPAEARGIVERLNSLLQQVESTIAAQNEFISNAAHQLRNPIAGVQAMAEAVASAPSAEAARSRAVELVGSARNASDLANKLLTLERARADAGHSAQDGVEIAAILDEVRALHATAAHDAGVTLRVDTRPGLPALNADPLMLQEALTNLVDNALRHGGPGLSRITLSAGPSGPDMLRVAVQDDGRGLSDKDVPVVLSRFGQVAPGAGSGLGLSIAEAVAERHGGRLHIDTTGPGLSVALELPVPA